MSEQSVIDFLLRGAWFRGRSSGLRPLAAASCLPLSALLVSALPVGALGQAPAPTYSQYSEAPQPGYGYNAAPQAPSSNPSPNPGPVVGQLAGQSDQQLAAEARLFEQQGRTAQAQRIYLELQRRSLLRGQTPQTPTFNNTPPSGYGAGATNSAGSLTQGPGPSTGLPSTAVNQNQVASPSYNPALRPFQPTPFPTSSAQAPVQPAMGWTPPATSTQPSVQTADGAQVAPQGIETPAAQSSSVVAPSSLNAASPETPPTSSVATTSVMVLDRQVSPAPRTVRQTASSESGSGGWRAAITPLPAALADPSTKPAPVSATASPSQGSLDLTPAPEQSANAAPAQPGLAHAAGRQNRSDSAISTPITAGHPLDLSRQAEADPANELPNIPTLPIPDMPGAATADAPVRPAAPVAQEPAAFLSPATGGERLAPAGDVSEPPGVVMFPSSPPTLRLTPTAVPKTVSVQADQESSQSILDAAAKLAKETDEIRIIPGYRSGGHAQLETVLNVDSKTDTSHDPDLGVPTKGWKTTFGDQQPIPKSVTRSAATTAPEASEEVRPASRVSARPSSATESADSGESRAARAARPAPFDVERPAETKTSLDLAALIRNPEFREIHTRPVIDGLELLSQPEPRHRLLGALRLGMAGADARTALPVLHQLLGAETNQDVLLRVAETVLKLQPNDRSALDALSRLLKDPADPDVRQAAAEALGGASPAGNPTAIVRLTDALDDPNPRVRIMAALSLAQFGPAAADAVSRLEVASTNDVPRMQRAAQAALASIRGAGPAAQNSAPPNSESPGPKPFQLVPADVENSASNPQTSNFNPSRVTPASARVEPAPVATIPAAVTASTTASKQPASRGAEPPLLPDVPSRPIDRASTQTNERAVQPAPALAVPMPAAALPALPDDSPLSLEGPSEGAKSGSTP